MRHLIKVMFLFGLGMLLGTWLLSARSGEARIESIKSETQRVLSPSLYDLTELQRHVNRLFGYSAQKTLELAHHVATEIHANLDAWKRPFPRPIGHLIGVVPLPQLGPHRLAVHLEQLEMNLVHVKFMHFLGAVLDFSQDQGGKHAANTAAVN